MSVSWKDTHQWLADTRLARKVTEAVFHARSRLHLARLDRRAPVRCQRRILLGLVHRAQATRFGLEHDFRRVRGVDDFRRLVPLRTPAELWRDYWQPALPRLAGATWPGPFAALAAPVAAPGAGYVAVALSPALLAAQRAALQTALALVLQARPHARLLAGTLALLGDGGPPAGKGAARDPDAAATARLPFLLRPYALTRPADAGRESADVAVRALADRGARGAVTCLAGPVERLVPMVQRVRALRGDDRLDRIWPGLAAVLYTRRSPAVSTAPLRRLVGEGVLMLETVCRPEGPLAVEDPRHDGMRLLFDHGTYFEFVPSAEAGRPGAQRHGVGDVETGTDYEVALTSPAGLWACRTGLVVRFDQRDLLVLRVVGPAVAQPPVRVDVDAAAIKVAAPHRPGDGIPAVPPESFVRSPWSTPWDRG